MKYLLLTAVILIMTAAVTCTSPPLPDSKIIMFEKPMESPWLVDTGDAAPIHEEIDVEPPADETTVDVDDPNDLEVTKEQMITEIIEVWDMFLDDANCGPDDNRRSMFPIYAEELADAIIMYQNKPTDIGGQLPEERDIHILMAVIVTKESSIRHDVVGEAPRFEVGLMQIHGVALAGYNPDIVQHNSRLGLLLGVRWFAAHMDACKIKKIPGDTVEWRTDDLVGPLSVYAGGHKAVKKNGTCYHYRVARERVNLTKLYLTRIDAASNT